MTHNQNPALKKFIRKLWSFLISNVGAFVIGFSALLIAVYQYALNRPILSYDAVTHNVISSLNDNRFKVMIENKEYDDLFQTVVILKNTGQQPLDGKDVSKIGHDPIRIILPKAAKTVHFTLDKTLTSDNVSVQLTPYKNDIVILFDYLNPGDQIAVTILHREPSDSFRVVGSALGLKTISHVLTDRQILYLVVYALIGLYVLTVFLGILDKKGYL
jgi:hypothetical protein